MSERTALYELYDAAGVLLYVGIGISRKTIYRHLGRSMT